MPSKTPLEIAILARAPRPGRCKTRLFPALGARGAARLQAQLIERSLRLGLSQGLSPTLWVTPDIRHPVFLKARRQGIRLRLQAAGNLGRKQQQAIRKGLEQAERVLVLGTDCPALDPTTLHRLRQGRGLQWVPATDGGYVALALESWPAGLFTAVDWGSPQVLRQVRRNTRRRGMPWQQLRALPDLDRPADWKAARRAAWIDGLLRVRG